MPIFHKVLVANRGEIACRILRTCRDLGLETVAVYSDADVQSPHVRLADEAVRIGPAPAPESYLHIPALLEAARRTGAEAIHPGYGFLSENAGFAEAVRAAGLVFIGPRPETIVAMGSKSGARAIMSGHGVPVVPGFMGPDQSDAAFVAAAVEIGFPVLIKASAGGGGKGMSIVGSADEVPAALAQARRLARSAFGDDTLLLERYVERPRHVEVQIFGDTHGHCVHLFERECSIQRRFQKIVEESPSPAPALTQAVRAALCDAGVTAARALGYEGAGTVEFLLDEAGRFYFLEVNTRLQVEHPVTEGVTGLDLVRLQVLVAQGARLADLLPADLQQRGHAIEVRLYAEDPANEFLPATGRLLEFEASPMEGIRIDAGVATGTKVDIDYDPLLAKLIAWGPTRLEAIMRLRGALGRLALQGVTTNRDFLRAVLGHPAFVAGETHTHFIADHFPPEQRIFPATADQLTWALLAATLGDAEARRATNPHVPAVRPGFRADRAATQWTTFAGPEGDARVEYRCTGTATGTGRYRARVGTGAWVDAVVSATGDGHLDLTVDGLRRVLRVVRDAELHAVRGPGFTVRLFEHDRFPERIAAQGHGGCRAPMPGRVVQVLVSAGESVAAGASLVILEAMKMEQVITAPQAGTVARICVEVGGRVEAGAILVELAS